VFYIVALCTAKPWTS